MTARRSSAGGRRSKVSPDDSANDPAKDSGPPFEQAVERIESIVDRLERGDLELEESLAHFEEGVRLARHCADQLETAERRVEVLLREGGEWVTRPFEPEPGDDGAEEDD